MHKKNLGVKLPSANFVKSGQKLDAITTSESHKMRSESWILSIIARVGESNIIS